MRVVSWNIGGGFISSRKEKIWDLENLDYFIKELKKINPDLICFQEIHSSKNNNQTKLIAKSLGFEYFEYIKIAKSHIKENENLGLSIISKYPILKSKFQKLTNPNLEFIWKGKKQKSHDKGFLEILINYKNNQIKVFCAHTVPFRKFGRDFLEDEFKIIRDEIEDLILKDNIPKIICVDINFNKEIDKLIPKIFNKKNNFKNILQNKITTPKNRRYDKIIISKEWKCEKFKIIEGKADHFLCYADIILNKII